MAVLNSWQKIDRVLTGQPFGDGKDGAYSSATIPTLVYKTCSGAADATKFAADTDATPFAVGDVILLHQTRGTGVGQWEIVRVASLGSDEYNTTTALKYTYTDSGASQAQATKIPRYTNVTVESGTWTIESWDGTTATTQGILTFACNGTYTQTGSITGNGANGSTSTGGTGKGYKGGNGSTDTAQTPSYQGEGTAAAGGTASSSANGSGGGGGVRDGDLAGGGGGGGNAAAGTNGTNGVNGGVTAEGGTGGALSGAADLTTATFGGAGGGGPKGNNTGTNVGGGGGAGAGISFIFAKTVADPTGTLSLNGGTGVNATYTADYRLTGGGGGGAGGSCLIACQTATIGTNKFTATAGSGGSGVTGGGGGGAGSAGRIAIHHSGAVTGTTNPTFTDQEDSSLVESGGGGNPMFFSDGGVTLG